MKPKAKYSWKQYSTSIRVSSPDPILHELLQTRLDCANHYLDYEISTMLYAKRYRRYRRGKNRCQYCGVKLNEEKS